MPYVKTGRPVGRPKGSKTGSAKLAATTKPSQTERQALHEARLETGRLLIKARQEAVQVLRATIASDQAATADKLSAARTILMATREEPGSTTNIALLVGSPDEDGTVTTGRAPVDILRERLAKLAARPQFTNQSTPADEPEDDQVPAPADTSERRAILPALVAEPAVLVVDADPEPQPSYGVPRVTVRPTTFEEIARRRSSSFSGGLL